MTDVKAPTPPKRDQPGWRASLILALLKVFGWLPLRALHGLGQAMAAVIWWRQGRSVRIARRNLEICFPQLAEHERQTMLRDTLRHSACTLSELPAIWTRSPQQIEALVRQVSGLDLLNEIHQSGRSVLVLAPHLGCWELLNLYLSARFPLTILYRPPRQAWLEPVLRRVRSRIRATQVRAESNAIRGLFRALRGNGMVGILPDQEPKQGEGVFAPFFGTEALTMVLPSRLIERTDCVPVMMFAERLPRGEGFHVHILTPPQPLAGSDPVSNASALNAAVEACVRLAPEQYQWIYKRFNIRQSKEDRGVLYR